MRGIKKETNGAKITHELFYHVLFRWIKEHFHNMKLLSGWGEMGYSVWEELNIEIANYISILYFGFMQSAENCYYLGEVKLGKIVKALSTK